MKIKIFMLFVFFISFTTYSLEVNNVMSYSFESNISLQREDIGEITDTVFISLNEETKTYEIRGSGKINKNKFRNYLDNSIENKRNYTIKIMDNNVLFPDDSSYLFTLLKETSLYTDIILPSDMNTSNVTNMSGMFKQAVNCNPDISNWDTSNVTNMSHMFVYAIKFNPDLSRWNTANVTNMFYMFLGNKFATPNVSEWNVSKVKDMDYMIELFDTGRVLDISKWNPIKLEDTDMYKKLLITYVKLFLNKLSKEEVNKIVDEINKEHKVLKFNAIRDKAINLNNSKQISRIDIGETPNAVFIFFNENTKTYEISGNGKISNEKFRKYLTKDVLNALIYTIKIMDNNVLFPDDSSYLFSLVKPGEQENLYTNILFPSNMNTSNVTNMSSMFEKIYTANPDVSNWDVSNVTNMSSMFKGTNNANPDVSRWDVSKVTDMSHMFKWTKNANPDVSSWDVANVTNMTSMFYGSYNANPDVSSWDVSNVINMTSMFCGSNINPDVSNWDVNNVTTMKNMFSDNNKANPNLSKWNPRSLTKPIEYRDILKIFVKKVLTNLNENQKNEIIKELDKADTVVKLNEIRDRAIQMNGGIPKESNLEQDKKKLENEINNKFKFLVNSQKEALKTEVSKAKTKEEIETIKNKASKLNDSMNELNAKKNELETLKSNEKYNNLSEEDKTSIDTLISKLSNYSEIDDKVKVDMLKNDMISKIEDIKSKLNALKSLENYKLEANKYIDTLSNLTLNEIELYKNEINSKINNQDIEMIKTKATNKNNVKEIINNLSNLTQEQKSLLKEELTDDNLEVIKNKASELNIVMNNLSIKKIELENFKNGENFEKLSTEDKNKIINLLERLNNNQNETNSEILNNLLNEVNNLIAKYNNEINEIENLKIEIKNKIDKELTRLIEMQKETLKAEITKSKTKAEIEEVKNRAILLNTSMNELNTKKIELESLKSNTEYIKLLDSDKTSLEELINKTNNFSEISNKEKVDNLKNSIISKINEIRNKLNDLSNVTNKKAEINDYIDNLSNLSQEEKINYKEKVNTKNTIEEIESVKILAINKNNVKENINSLLSLSEIQKTSLKNELTDDNLETIKNKAISLNTSMNNLSKKREELSKINKDKFSKENKLKIEEYMNKNVENILKSEEIDRIIEEISNFLLSLRVDLNKYKSYISLFSYDNIDIVNNFNENFYFNYNLSKSIKEVLEDLVNNRFDALGLISGANVGFNLDVVKNIKIGGFIEYERNTANHISIGTNISHKDGLGFIRYRLATHNKLINHNVDLYGRYRKEIDIIENLKIIPALGLYLAYSSLTNIDEFVYLDHRISVLGDIESKISYNNNGLEAYIIPSIKFGYNGVRLVDKNYKDNTLREAKEYFIYNLNAGINNEFKNRVSLKLNLGIRGNEKGSFRFNSNIGIGYKF